MERKEGRTNGHFHGTTVQCDFDSLFDGGQAMPCSEVQLRLEEQEEEEDRGEQEEQEGQQEEEGTGQVIIRKFSTLQGGKKVIEEPGLRKPSEKSCPLHRVVIIGSAEVGKTTLVKNLASSSSSFTEEHSPHEASSLCEVELDGARTKMEFWDPQPPTILWLGLVHGDPQAALQLQELEASVLLVVYSVDDNSSLTNAARLLSSFKRGGQLEGRPCLLVANKADLVRSREVATGQGRDLAGRYGLCYLEVSSGLGYNIEQLLVKICQEIQSKNLKPLKKPSIREKVLGLVAKKYSK